MASVHGTYPAGCLGLQVVYVPAQWGHGVLNIEARDQPAGPPASIFDRP
jgi:hypothetical protein